jgi:hypothetical protein
MENDSSTKNKFKESKMGNRGGQAAASIGGMFWFAGWLFTISFANLVWWKIILGIVVWPFFLGQSVG